MQALVKPDSTAPAHAPQSASGADRYQVVVHVSAETSEEQTSAKRVSAENAASESRENDVSAETPHPFQTDRHLEDGPHVSAETARRLSCDAAKIEVSVDNRGEPLNIGGLPPLPDDADPREWLQAELDDLWIDAETAVTRWRGVRIAWDLAVGHLFN